MGITIQDQEASVGIKHMAKYTHDELQELVKDKESISFHFDGTQFGEAA